MRQSKLTFEEIRRLAEDYAYEHWKEFMNAGEYPLIDMCLNVRRAWMFFRNTSIEIPDSAHLRRCAIVVSDKGEVRYTADFYPDLNQCRNYLEEMAEHFDEKDI